MCLKNKVRKSDQGEYGDEERTDFALGRMRAEDRLNAHKLYTIFLTLASRGSLSSPQCFLSITHSAQRCLRTELLLHTQTLPMGEPSLAPVK